MVWFNVSTVWGNVKPTSVVGYKIVVCPGSQHKTCWEFVVLIPSGDQEVEDIVTVKQMSELVLEIGDRFSMYRLNQEESADYSLMPVLWIDPNTAKPAWLQPPLAAMN